MEDIPDDIDEQTLYRIAEEFDLLPPEEIDPATAVEKFHEEKESDVVASTTRSHDTRLRKFVAWCEESDIESLADVSTKDLQTYYADVKETLSPKSLDKYLGTLRQFLRYCEGENWAETGLHASVPDPDIDEEDEVRTETVPYETTTQIVEYLDQYEPYTCEHVIWALLAETGARLSGFRSLDVDDVLYHEGDHFLRFEHRPEQGTRLKNGRGSERTIRISEYVVDVIERYLDRPREDPIDEYGREALLSVGFGRVSESTIRKYVYRWTQPCQYSGECPHGRDLSECEYRTNQYANQCPSSKSPHPVRRGYITEMRRRGCHPTTIDHRCDVSERVVEKHYDQRTEFEKARASYRGPPATTHPAPFSSTQTRGNATPPSAKPERGTERHPEGAE